MTEATQALLSVTEANDLARELVADLGSVPGDAGAVTEVLTDWLDDLGPDVMAFVCMAAVRLTFADCLRVADVPAEERNAA